MANLKPILAGLGASALTDLCFLIWVHSKAASFAEGQDKTDWIALVGSHAHALFPKSIRRVRLWTSTEARIQGNTRQSSAKRNLYFLRFWRTNGASLVTSTIHPLLSAVRA